MYLNVKCKNDFFWSGSCRADKDAEDAEYVCKHLQIPFHHTNFVKEYWNEVFNNLINEYQEGWTPNPDVDCNKYIKFGHFYKYCLEKIGCNAVATGHYARLVCILQDVQFVLHNVLHTLLG